MVILFVLLVVTADFSFGARILAVLPYPARSHHNMFQAVLTTLAMRGHHVVNYSPFPLDKPVPNYTDVFINTFVASEKLGGRDELASYTNRSPIKAFVNYILPDSEVTKNALQNEKLIKLLESSETFDLLILEPFFAQEALLGFGHKFKAPVICLQTFASLSLVNKASGNTLSLMHIPDYAFPYSDDMSFFERFLSAYSVLSTLYMYYTHYLPTQEQVMKYCFKDPTLPPLVDMIHNISLFVSNMHPYVHYSHPYTPNLIPVGGIHLSGEQKPLPSAIKRFLDEAKHGVIYFSLGSFLPDRQLPQQFLQNFISVFRRLPQRVLWKTGAQPVGLPDTVMTSTWVPQQDVLSHPNIVIFMTHGGLLSQHEAINAAVPVVCIPFFGDQPFNAKFYEKFQIGVQIPISNLSEETIYLALTTVLKSPKYRSNMQVLSRVYRDQPLSPTDTLVFWVEYVLRHRGAPHLRPSSTYLSWYQLALLDVLTSILTPFMLVLAALFFVARKALFFIKKVCPAPNQKKRSDGPK